MRERRMREKRIGRAIVVVGHLTRSQGVSLIKSSFVGV